MKTNNHTLNLNGKLVSLQQPWIMGILNVTPDSFYAASRKESEEAITERVIQILEEGGQIIDIGAYSSRPQATHISTSEEMKRLRHGLEIIRKTAPEAIISVDTFRSDIARMCVEEYGVSFINDIAAGEMDPHMFQTVSQLHVPYIMMHMQGTPQNMQENPHYQNIVIDIINYFDRKIRELHEMGVQDIIVDPGFGFGKTLEDNYQLMHHLEDFHILDRPILVGVSRKSMIYKLLDTTPEEALNGTSVLHTLVLLKGAHILRVHDVKACAEVVKIVRQTQAI